MVKHTLTITLQVNEAKEILSCLKQTLEPLKKFKSELEYNIKKWKYNNTQYTPGIEVEALKQERAKTIKECYFKYKNLGIQEMVKRTRKETEHLPWCSWDLVYAELRQIKKKLEPKKGQLWLLQELI